MYGSALVGHVFGGPRQQAPTRLWHYSPFIVGTF